MAKPDLSKRLWITAGQALKAGESAAQQIQKAGERVDWEKVEELTKHPLARRLATHASRRLPLTPQQKALGSKLLETGVRKLSQDQKSRKENKLLSDLLKDDNY